MLSWAWFTISPSAKGPIDPSCVQFDEFCCIFRIHEILWGLVFRSRFPGASVAFSVWNPWRFLMWLLSGMSYIQRSSQNIGSKGEAQRTNAVWGSGSYDVATNLQFLEFCNTILSKSSIKWSGNMIALACTVSPVGMVQGGNTALLLAARGRHEEAINLLLNRGVDFESQKSVRYLPLLLSFVPCYLSTAPITAPAHSDL